MTLEISKIRRSLAAGLLLCAAFSASANTIVTFQVDMNVAATNGTFDPGTQTVAVHGSFNSFGTFNLTNNPAGANPKLYSGTTNLPDNGVVISYKYTIEPGALYETTATHNRLLDLPAASGSSVVVTPAYYSDIPPDGTAPFTVTFQANMAQQINVGAFNPNTSFVYARGTFNGWGQDVAMTNDPSILITNQFGLVTSNVYVSTYDITGSPGKTLDFKFFIDTGANWEVLNSGLGKDSSDSNNRYFNLAASGPQKLPILFFNDSPYAPLATNAVTFQVDMSVQQLLGQFDPSTATVEIRGNFNGWGGSQILATNNPAAANTNLYTVVVPISDGVGATEQYKFWSSANVNGGWETMADNRTLKVVDATAQTLPKVFFSNQGPGDFLASDTLVTFSVNMTNAVGTDAHAFDPVNDHVYVNGIFGFVAWDAGSLAGFELTNNPIGSKLYSLQVLMPKATPVQVTYKYSINGSDNEAGVGANHVRYIRQTGSYVLPLDTFGHQLVEDSFGNLKASASTAGHVLISWLGRPGVNLQTRSSLSSGTWQDHPETDGLSSTNWPSAGGALFFRLIKPY